MNPPLRPLTIGERPLTVGDLRALLQTFEDHQRLVFSDIRYGDFDLIGFDGGQLSEDNFVHDIRPILRLQKRED